MAEARRKARKGQEDAVATQALARYLGESAQQFRDPAKQMSF